MKKLLYVLLLFSYTGLAMDATEIRRPGEGGKELALLTDKRDTCSGGDKGSNNFDDDGELAMAMPMIEKKDAEEDKDANLSDHEEEPDTMDPDAVSESATSEGSLGLRKYLFPALVLIVAIVAIRFLDKRSAERK